MRDYGKVHTSFWSSPTIRSMSEDARTLAIYLVTSPHSNMAGTFRLPDGYVCEDLNWTPERVSKAFAETLDKGFANRCETTKWVWICKHFTWNPPENPNQRKGAAKVAESIPEMCAWKLDFMRGCGEFLGIPKPEKANPFKTLSKPFPNQEPEPEPEPEVCAKPQSALPPAPDPEVEVVATIPLVDKTEFQITREMVDEWTETFPAVDVKASLLRMRTWSNANPANKKTSRGVSAFIVRWLGKEQDSAARIPGRQNAAEGIFAGAI